jgi:hypothetical protein
MNVSSVKTKEYENKRLCIRGEKQTQSNPIKPNCKPTTPFFKISLKNPYFLLFSDFFYLLFSLFSLSSVVLLCKILVKAIPPPTARNIVEICLPVMLRSAIWGCGVS